MAIKERLTRVQLLMLLAAMLMLCLGCGTADESIVEPDTTVEPEVSTEEPDSVIPIDMPVEEVDESTVQPDPVIPADMPAEEVGDVEEVVTTVRGLVLDQITKAPLSNVRVQLTDEAGVASEALTTAAGVFEFENVTANEGLTVSIDPDEYEKQEFVVDPIPVGETVKVQVELIPLNPDQLPEGDGLVVGVQAPDFNLPDSDEEMVALADYAGKQKVVLVFDRGEW